MNFKRSHRPCAARPRLAPSQFLPAARGFPNSRQPGTLGGQSAIRSFWGLGNRYALTILTVLMWRWCRRRWVLDGSLRGLAGLKFFAGLAASRYLPNQTVGSPGKSFCAPANHAGRRCPAEARAPSGARRGYLGTGPTPVSKFFQTFFASSKSSLGRPHQLQLLLLRQRLTSTTGHRFPAPVAVTQEEVDLIVAAQA